MQLSWAGARFNRYLLLESQSLDDVGRWSPFFVICNVAHYRLACRGNLAAAAQKLSRRAENTHWSLRRFTLLLPLATLAVASADDFGQQPVKCSAVVLQPLKPDRELLRLSISSIALL